MTNQSIQHEKASQEHSTPFHEMVETAFQMVRNVRFRYGQARFELGYLLHIIEQQSLWVGKAESFPAFVDDLRLNRNACRMYMRVASKFIVELGCSDTLIAQLSHCNVGVLDKAAQILNAENAADIIPAVLALHQRDALSVIQEFDPAVGKRNEPDDVSKLFSRYLDLTDDRRIDFMNKLNPNRNRNYAG